MIKAQKQALAVNELVKQQLSEKNTIIEKLSKDLQQTTNALMKMTVVYQQLRSQVTTIKSTGATQGQEAVPPSAVLGAAQPIAEAAQPKAEEKTEEKAPKEEEEMQARPALAKTTSESSDKTEEGDPAEPETSEVSQATKRPLEETASEEQPPAKAIKSSEE